MAKMAQSRTLVNELFSPSDPMTPTPQTPPSQPDDSHASPSPYSLVPMSKVTLTKFSALSIQDEVYFKEVLKVLEEDLLQYQALTTARIATLESIWETDPFSIFEVLDSIVNTKTVPASVHKVPNKEDNNSFEEHPTSADVQNKIEGSTTLFNSINEKLYYFPQ